MMEKCTKSKNPIQGFFEELPEATKKIDEGVKANDLETVKHVSHKMVSSAKIFRLNELSFLLKTIEERAWKGEELEESSHLSKELSIKSNKVQKELEQDLSRLAP